MKLNVLTELRQRRKAKVRDPRRERRQRIVAMSVLTGLALIATPIARPLGYTLADGLCSGEGCTATVGKMPVCSGVGRDKAISSSLMSFSTVVPAKKRLSLSGSVNGSVKLASTNPDGSIDIYSFSDQDQAKRFVFDDSTTLPRAVDAGVGPTTDGVYHGFTRVLAGVGLIPDNVAEPAETAQRFSTITGFEGTLRQSSRGSTQTTVVPLPSRSTLSLNRLAASLGITGALVTEVRVASDGSPQSIAFSGPAANAWSMNVVKNSDFNGGTPDTKVLMKDGGFVVRSYLLDLTQESNRNAYEGIVDKKSLKGASVEVLKAGKFDQAVAEGKAKVNPYAFMRDRVRDAAVVTETTFGATGEVSLENVTEKYSQHSLMKESTAGLEAREVQAADLALPNAQFAPFVSCETES